jgi:DNA topoisomerase-1
MSPAVPRTRRVDCSSPGIVRVRRGRGFGYVGPAGERIDDAEQLARIRALAIPPAWTEVWICGDARGHIQATGIDAAGRKQYRYHDDWRRRRDQAKFDAMVEFARALPRLRRRVAEDLERDALDRRRVLACAVRLLDIGFFRIGSEDYASQNETYGLTTLLKRHVRVRDELVVFDYPAKHGAQRRQQVADPGVREIVRALKRRRGGGRELLAWKERGRWVDVRADDVNAYIKDVTGGDFTAKDFRTWNATALAAVALAVKARVIDRFASGLTIADALAEPAEPDPDAPIDERPVDERVRRAVLDLIAGDEDAAGIERVAEQAA